VGPFVGELYWEYFRFAPYVFKKNPKNYPLVVLTRPDRYDIYGERAIEFSPLTIKGDSIKRFGECFRMMGLTGDDYLRISTAFRKEMEKKYRIIDHIIPPIAKPDYLNKDYFPIKDRLFEYIPRDKNVDIIDNFLKDVTKPIVIIAPRYRKNFKRNWPYWQQFYDKIYDTKWNEKFEFIICGKEHEYVPDDKFRFKDLSFIKEQDGMSLFGLLLEIMKRSELTVGSQSAIPNISLMNKVPVIQWGNQRKLHTVTYNIHKTPVRFFDSPNFDIDINKVFNAMIIQLNEIMKTKQMRR